MWIRKCITLFVVFVFIPKQINATYPCEIDPDCTGITGSTCEYKECSCPPGELINSNGTSCIKSSSYPLSLCTERQQCQRLFTGYTCDIERSVCVCTEGYRYLDGRCWPRVEFGETCVVRQQCYNRLLPFSLDCVDGVCACAEGYYSRQRGSCRKIVDKIGASCVLDMDCQIPNVTARCVNMICSRSSMRAEEIIEVGENFVIQPSNVLEGDPCKVNEDCAGLNNSECSPLKHCICKRSYFPSSDRTTCLGELGQKNTDRDCSQVSPMAVLDDGTCVCRNGFFYDQYLRSCIKPTRNFNESCVNADSCYTFGEAAICVQNPQNQFLKVCDCNTTVSYKDESRMLCVNLEIFLGDNCTISEECPLNSECIDGICRCSNNTIPTPDETGCIRVNLTLGEPCVSDIQCELERAECSEGVCSCKSEFTQLEGECFRGIGADCKNNQDCEFDNGSCNNMTCACENNFVDVGIYCLRKANGTGDNCTDSKQCWDALGGPEGAACRNMMCDCVDGYHFVENRCWKTMQLGMLCTSQQQCFLPGEQSDRVECRNSLCKCKWEYETVLEQNKCNGSTSLEISHLSIILFLLYFFARNLCG